MNVKCSTSNNDAKPQGHSAEAKEQRNSMEIREEILTSAAMPAKQCRLCCVHGCERQLVPPRSPDLCFRWSKFSTHSSEGESKKQLLHYAIKDICGMHYSRLRRARDSALKARPRRSRSPKTLQLSLWTSTELSTNAARQCSARNITMNT